MSKTKQTEAPADPFAALAKPKTPAAKKSKIPVIPSEGLAMEIKDWLSADEELKNATAKKAAAEAIILPHAEELRLSQSVETQECLASVRLASESGTITVTQACRYSDVEAPVLPDLRERFGADFDRYFVTDRKITVKKSADLKALAALVGADRLNEFFDVVQVAKVTEAFHSDRSINPKVAKKATDLIGSDIVPAKAGVRAYSKDSE